jgi:hypothetical protein
MRNRLLLASFCLLGFGCTSATRTPGGGTGGEEETGGSSGGSTGGSTGSKTGGSSGSKTGGTSGGDTGGSTGSTGGSTGSTGGSTGSTGGSAGSAGGGCAGSGAKLCDDFDAQMMGAEPKGMYSIEKMGGTLTVENTKPFSGTQSLHIHLNNPPGDSKAQLAFVAPLLPFANNDVHGRVMVWLMKNPGAHWDFATAFGTDQPQDDDTKIQYTVGSMSGHMMAVYQPGDDSVDSTTPFPVGKWACLQWEFKGAADGTHLLKMMVDGQVVDKGQITKGGIAKSNWPATTWKSMKVGFVTWGSVNFAVDMWLDDLAISDSDIPCPAPK